MNKKVKDWNLNIYPHLVKTMDSHYTAIGIACETQQYVDWGVKMDSTTSHDTAYYAHRPQQSNRINRQKELKQPPRSNKRPTHSQQSSSSKHGRDYYQTQRMHNRNTEPAKCRNYTRGVNSYNRRNCPYHHPPTSYSGSGPCRSNGWGYTTHRHRGTGFSVRTRWNVMARPLFFHPSHHIFNLQKLSMHLSPLVKATFTVKGITFSGIAMLDSGCSTCIIPISQLSKEAKKHLTHSDVHIKGINGSITALGELYCNINIGNRDWPIFEDINVLVTTQDTPILIRQNILTHNPLDSYIIDNQNATVEFRRTLTSGYPVHTAPISLVLTSPHGPAYGSLTIHINNQSTIGPQPNIQTLDQKLVGLLLPNHPNRDELEAIADLLIRYTDIIGTENGIKGTFIQAVRILTVNLAPKNNTQLPRSRKQTSMPK